MATSYKTKSAADYESQFADYVRSEVERQGWNLTPNKLQHFYVDVTAYFDRTDRDCNNYWKVMLDAITDTQLVWIDDNVVCERINRILYDAHNPRIELTIYPVDYIGIFDNADQMRQFTEMNCADCIRYQRNCSILRKAVEGRVQDEISQLSCKKRKIKKEAKENK